MLQYSQRFPLKKYEFIYKIKVFRIRFIVLFVNTLYFFACFRNEIEMSLFVFF